MCIRDSNYGEVQQVTRQVLSCIEQTTISVEEVQDIVEGELMKVRPDVAKRYIIYMEWRNTQRHNRCLLYTSILPLIAGGLLSLGSCTRDFGDINRNPLNPNLEDLNKDNILGSAYLPDLQLSLIHI